MINTSGLEGATILAVDDNATNLEALSDYLGELGCTVLLKLNGKQALALLERRSPDLILLDIVMPEMSGFELCRQIKNRPHSKDIPVIFMSALSDTIDKVKGFELGAVDYITKPFQHEELFSRIKAHLTIRQLQQDLQGKNEELQVLLEKEREALERERKLTDDLRLNLSLSLPHELRTPLNVILGYSEILMNPGSVSGPDEIAECASGIYRNGKRLHRLVENSLLYANLKLLKYTPGDRRSWLRETPIELKRFVSLVSQRKAKEMQRQDDLFLELDTINVRVSPPNFEKILLELLDNAFKFSNHGSQVYIRTSINAKLCILSIQDRGRGMTQTQIDSVGAYMQFERSHYEQQGTGLGLVVAHLLAELEGAVISIDSQPEEGTTISLVLHCEATSPSQNSLSSQSAIIGYHGAKRHILLIAAQAETRAMFCDLLIPLGFEITETGKWKEGLNKARALLPELILLQQELVPEEGEASLLQQFRESFPMENTLVVGLAGGSGGRFCDETGYDAVLAAPMQADELLDFLQSALGLSWLYQEQDVFDERPASEFLPSPQVLEELKQLTQLADIMAIRHWSETLVQQDGRFKAFSQKVLQLANNFDFDGLQRLLDKV